MKKNSIARASIMIAVLGMVSKAMGIVRVSLIASRFGQGVETDAYTASVDITTMTMSIIGAALFTSLVPVLCQINEKHGKKGKIKFFNNITNMVLLMALALTVLLYIFAPVVVKLMYSKYDPQTMQLAVELTRLSVPTVMALAVMNLVTGYLHSYNVYGPYALMGIPYNLTFFVYLIFFTPSIQGLVLITILATATQFMIQLPATFKTGYRWRPKINFKDPYVFHTIDLVIPVAIGQAAQQINVIVDRNLASGLQSGIVAAMANSTKVNDAIIAIFIAGFTTVMFPMIATAFQKNDRNQIVKLINDGIGAVFLITIPATIGIMALSNEMIRLIFERRQFTPEDTILTSGLLFFYSLGLTGSGVRMLFTKVYYSLHDMKTPMINGLIAVFFNIVLNIILVQFMQERGLALATSLSITISTVVLVFQLRKKIPEVHYRGIVVEFIKVLAAAGVMGLSVMLIKNALIPVIGSLAIRLLLTIFSAIIVYAVCVIIFRVKALDVYVQGFKKKMIKG